MSEEQVPARLYFILARNSPVGVIFRRGPSKWVRIIKWNTKTDEFEPGQWFHGRIYDMRSDLSPDGSLMIYFAQKITGRSLQDDKYTYAWTAISKLPYLTALALWPKGNCWHGGGLFETNSYVWLNHRPNVARAHGAHLPPRSLKVTPNPQACGEDAPVLYRRLERDGWRRTQEWDIEQVSSGFRTLRPGIWRKEHPSSRLSLVMKESIARFHWRFEFEVACSGGRRVGVENAEWADWDHRGRLVYVSQGRLFAATISDECELTSKQLADFNDMKPEPIRTPKWAKIWR